jgi:hypothetical protein
MLGYRCRRSFRHTGASKTMAGDDTITFALDGEISLSTFRTAVDRFDRLVGSLTEELAPQARIRWVVEGLEAGIRSPSTATCSADWQPGFLVFSIVGR